METPQVISSGASHEKQWDNIWTYCVPVPKSRSNQLSIFFDYAKSYLVYLFPSFADIFPFILPVKLPEGNSSLFKLLGNRMRVQVIENLVPIS